MKRVSLVYPLMAAVMLTVALAPTRAQEKSAAAPKVLRMAPGKTRSCRPYTQDPLIEIFLAHPDAKTGKLVAECYNTIFTSKGIPRSKDTARRRWSRASTSQDEDGLWRSRRIVERTETLVPDWTEIDVGVERDFNGIKAAWLPDSTCGDNTGGCRRKQRPTSPRPSHGRAGWVGTKAPPSCCLTMLKGNTWIMKGFQLESQADEHTYEQFVAGAQVTSRSSRRAEKVPGVKTVVQGL